jgi:hypothetical protein
MTAVSTGLQAAFRLARGQRDGMADLAAPEAPDTAVAAASFLALAASLPLEFLQGWLGGTEGHQLLRDVMVAVVGWLGFAVVSHRVALRTGRQALWPRYIAAWNWCSLLQSLLLTLGLATSLLGLPPLVSETLVLVIVGWAVWLEYFVARVALGFGLWQGIAMVALDYAISQVAQNVMDRLN